MDTHEGSWASPTGGHGDPPINASTANGRLTLKKGIHGIGEPKSCSPPQETWYSGMLSSLPTPLERSVIFRDSEFEGAIRILSWSKQGLPIHG
jgi:hypothetical protein